jgi:erythromycin esterase
MLLTLSAATALAAEPPVLVNPSFRPAEPGGGKPAGWTLLDGGGDVRAECAATCALHVQAPDGSVQPVGVYQQIPAGSAAGHRLILSGRIRTEHTDGRAVLGVRVTGDAGIIGETLEGAAVPNGTTDWRRFEVAIPVPANATGLAIGAMLGGQGSAWFDSLELRVDESATVAAFVPPPPPPARPVPSQRLLDDAALRLAEADLPTIPAAWRDDVRARRHPIRSLFSDDFSDLQFLKPLLAGKRIVQLGETAHGVAESNWAKVRLIKFLHQELGFDVVAFESSFDQCHEADKQVGKVTPHEVMARCLFPMWQTREVDGLFDYMAAVRKSARPLSLAGFDIQFTTVTVDKAQLRAMLAAAHADPALAAQLEDREREVGVYQLLTPQRSAEVQAYYGAIADALDARRAALRAAGFDPAEIGMEIQAAHARAWLARHHEHMHDIASNEGNTLRDAGMAEQLDYVLDKLYPRRKVIVWAHNAHVNNARTADGFVPMGERLAQRRRAGMYTVGFYVGHGVIANASDPYPVGAPPPGTLESVLANAGLASVFVDFSKAAPGSSTAWFTEKNTVREFGNQPREIVPARSFDGVLYIDAVTPAQKY